MLRTYSKMHPTDNYSQHSSIIWAVWLNVWVLVYKLTGWGFESSLAHLNLKCLAFLGKEFLGIQAAVECGFTLKHVPDMKRTYSLMNCSSKYTQHSSIIWPVWLNGPVSVYELSGFGFDSSCSHLNVRFCACFEQGVHWDLGYYRVRIHFETRTWHDKNI